MRKQANVFMRVLGRTYWRGLLIKFP